MLMSPKIRELTFNAAPTEEIRRAAIAEGMKTLYWDGIDKVLRGVTTLEEVFDGKRRSDSEGQTRRLRLRHNNWQPPTPAANNLRATPRFRNRATEQASAPGPGAHTF